MIDDLLDDEPRHHDRIAVNPAVMVGKPVVKGTRIPVAVVLDQLSVELDLRDLFAAYPDLTEEDVRACLRYAADVLDGEDIVPAFVPQPRLHPAGHEVPAGRERRSAAGRPS